MMHLLKYIMILLLPALLLAGCKEAATTAQLRFRDDGTFLILQFTDIHWNDGSVNCAYTEAVIKETVICEAPDLVIITGDVVMDPPAKEGWKNIIRIMGDTETPWAVIMGNHDGEAEEGITKEMIFDWLEGSEGYIGSRGPEKLTGIGNFDLPVLASGSDEIAAVLYCFDSNEYTFDRNFGKYDWIHSDQIEWYCHLSESYRHEGQPLPALAFLHIPLPEYKVIQADTESYGNRFEGVASPEINSGLFSRFVQNGDVMGVFCGHDHDNDYIGIANKIALGFGRVTGADAYGRLERGGRAILLYENQRKFDTWITTPAVKEPTWYYPIALTSLEERKSKYMPATDTATSGNGLKYKYYEGTRIRHTSDIAEARLISEGVAANFSLEHAQREDSMALVFEGLIRIPEKGIYRFYTYSDDGSVLNIDGEVIVDNDGSHDARRRDGKVALDAGLHRIELKYFQDYMGKQLEVGFSSKNISERALPDSILLLP